MTHSTDLHAELEGASLHVYAVAQSVRVAGEIELSVKLHNIFDWMSEQVDAVAPSAEVTK